jgi:hypothetical protein
MPKSTTYYTHAFSLTYWTIKTLLISAKFNYRTGNYQKEVKVESASASASNQRKQNQTVVLITSHPLWFASLLVCWFLVCWFTGLLVRWFTGLLVCWFAGLLFAGLLFAGLLFASLLVCWFSCLQLLLMHTNEFFSAVAQLDVFHNHFPDSFTAWCKVDRLCFTFSKPPSYPQRSQETQGYVYHII